MVIAPDASAILKWVLEREDEAGNILGIKQPEHAGEAMKALLAYEFPEEPLGRDYCLAVLGLMREVKGASFYDAAYHVLAIQIQGTYVTADANYVKKAKRKGHLTLLSDWHPPTAPR